MNGPYRVYFVRVRDGVVIEKGMTDVPGFDDMKQQSDEYLPVSPGEYASAQLAEPFEDQAP